MAKTSEQKLSALFQFNEDVWLKHANPWSVYTRALSSPLLVIGVWSRQWIGWYCLIPIAIVMLWIWLNPRLFPAPKSFNNWASKSVMGERLLANDPPKALLDYHKPMRNLLNSLSGVGFLLMVLGLIWLHIWLTIIGVLLQIIFKFWYLDRMVWLMESAAAKNPEYQSWIDQPSYDQIS